MFVVHRQKRQFIRPWFPFDLLGVVPIRIRNKHRFCGLAPVGKNCWLSCQFRLLQFVHRHIEVGVTHFEPNAVLISISAVAGEVHKADEKKPIGNQSILQKRLHLFFVLETTACPVLRAWRPRFFRFAAVFKHVAGDIAGRSVRC